MKKYISILFILAGFAFQSCEKEDSPGYNYDFSNSLPPYAELSSRTTVAVKQGATANITLRVRTAFQEPVTLQYTITGAINTTGTATIARNTTSIVVPVAVPANAVPAGQDAVTALFTLNSAKKGDEELRVGHAKPDAERVTIRITK